MEINPNEIIGLYKQRVSNLDYENMILKMQMTLLEEENKRLQKELSELKGELSEEKK